jgi:hypothetical protein
VWGEVARTAVEAARSAPTLGIDNFSRITTLRTGGKGLTEEGQMVEEALSPGESRLLVRSPEEAVVSEQAESEVSRWLVALVALGAVGVLVGFWLLVAWGLYARST